uniref:Uncharacterized protein n=1 Tax=Myotis myotis TaxID=51298 RepID=A0A7J7ZWS9_MYOMY|nr:hypothetical protein mMyoMyo1_009674 [Myotis myotis]
MNSRLVLFPKPLLHIYIWFFSCGNSALNEGALNTQRHVGRLSLQSHKLKNRAAMNQVLATPSSHGTVSCADFLVSMNVCVLRVPHLNRFSCVDSLMCLEIHVLTEALPILSIFVVSLQCGLSDGCGDWSSR